MRSAVAIRRLPQRLGGVLAPHVRALSTPPPPAPSPAELEKIVKDAEVNVTRIREGTYRIVQSPVVSDVPDAPEYLPADIKEMAVLTDQPLQQKSRKVIIRQKAQNAMQSGPVKSYPWTITWPNQERWSNPLTGWTSTNDPMSNQTLFFDSPEEATRFAERQGWSYHVEAPIQRPLVLGTKKYAHNFLAEAVENKLKREGVKTKEYVHEGAATSGWFQFLKFHGDGEVDQHGPAAPKSEPVWITPKSAKPAGAPAAAPRAAPAPAPAPASPRKPVKAAEEAEPPKKAVKVEETEAPRKAVKAEETEGSPKPRGGKGKGAGRGGNKSS